MSKIKNKKKLVEDLVNTFNDRDELHIAYKANMSNLIYNALRAFILEAEECEDGAKINIGDWCDQFVEKVCFKERE